MIRLNIFLWLFLFAFSAKCATLKDDNSFELSVIHINDFHSRYLQTSVSGSRCQSSVDYCIGGFSRNYKQITSMLEENPNSLLLNGGGNFGGTLFYTVGKWNITREFLNKLPFDASVLGSSEFDDGLEGLTAFIKALNHTIVVTNLDDSLETDFQGLYVKSKVVEKNGKKIGILGVMLSTTNQIVNAGKLKFLPESATVNAEAERLAKEEGVYTNIVLSHCGYQFDVETLAANASDKITLIVGGGSQTYLYTGDLDTSPNNPDGPYPTIVDADNGKTVYVVQASSFGRYIGNITLKFDENADLVSYSGKPEYVDSSKPEDNDTTQAILPWKDLVDNIGDQVMGKTLIKLDNSTCHVGECTMGDFVADAMVYAYTGLGEEGSWTYASMAIASPDRGMRRFISAGDNITFKDLLLSEPFQDTINVAEIQGKYIKEVLEFVVQEDLYYEPLQLSGIQVVYNMSRPVLDRVTSVKVRCQACAEASYEDLDLEKTYRLILPSFISDGTVGLIMVSQNMLSLHYGKLNYEVFQNYLKDLSPIVELEGGRITIVH